MKKNPIKRKINALEQKMKETVSEEKEKTDDNNPPKTEQVVQIQVPAHWGQVLGTLQAIQQKKTSIISKPGEDPRKMPPLPVESMLMCLIELKNIEEMHKALFTALGRKGSMVDFVKMFKKVYRPVKPAREGEENG